MRKNVAWLGRVAMTASALVVAIVASGAPQDDRAAIESVLTDLAQGQDQQDVDRMLSSLHPDSAQFVQLPSGLVTFDRDTQAAGVRAGQLGGDDREMTIHSVDITGNAAMAKLELVGRLTFVHYVGLMKVEGRWQIMSVVTSVSGL
ncbi:MAG: hypothetical protein GKS06_02040 [Acidobacteria bacterium]|nr:hypothetical protein [Acidobacteriota bacterium]